MTDYATITDAAAALRRGDVASVDLTSAAIARADELDTTLGVFTSRYSEHALAAAEEADAEFSAGRDSGVLQGIPIGIKDIISTREGPSTAQSLVLDPQWGVSQGDAAVVSRLRHGGAVILGKLTTSEFACGMPDLDRPFPIPRNPWDAERWAGGSSSGAGSAVATGMALGALGTDTAGSIRIPASYCGVTGLLPTFGRVPTSGCVPFGFSLDRVGPITRTAMDAAHVLSVIAGLHPDDLGSMDGTPVDFCEGLTGDITGLRIGVQQLDDFAQFQDAALSSVFGEAVARLGRLGAEIVDVDLPLYTEMMTAQYVISFSEALAYHLPDLQRRWPDYAPGTRDLLGTGLFISGADYVQAQRARRVAQQEIAAVFTDLDAIVTPTTSTSAIRVDSAQAMLEVLTGSMLTSYWNTLGCPALSVPMGVGADGLPLGLQIATAAYEEVTALRIGDAYQRSTEWHLREPPMPRAAVD